jgi:vitamin K-dependent gamma-carboxylase
VTNFRIHIESWINKTGFFEPVENAPLILFRICYGFIMIIECSVAFTTGWIKSHFIDPPFTFTFIGFEWLQPLPNDGMYYFYGIMALTAFMIMLGLYYRLAALSFLILWTITYLMQKSEYNNHYYLIILLSLIMVFVPAADYFSLDSWRKKTKFLTCPRWCLIILKFQVSVVYIYSGINKINSDWLKGLTMHTALSYKANETILGTYLNTPFMEAFITYGGLTFDLLIVFFLIYSRTRILAFVLLLFFHLFNALIFQVGIFPYTMIILSIFFFSPETIRTIFFKNKLQIVSENTSRIKYSKNQLVQFSFIGIYMILQILIPLRPYLFSGNTSWTEEGHRMSWRMMLRIKSGDIYFKVKEENKNTIIYPNNYLTETQFEALACHPDLIWQYSQHLKKEFKRKKNTDPEIFAYSYVSLNGRAPQLFVDTLVNLADVKWDPWKHSKWILTMKEP